MGDWSSEKLMVRALRDISEEWLVIEAQCGDAESWDLFIEIQDMPVGYWVVFERLGHG